MHASHTRTQTANQILNDNNNDDGDNNFLENIIWKGLAVFAEKPENILCVLWNK